MADGLKYNSPSYSRINVGRRKNNPPSQQWMEIFVDDSRELWPLWTVDSGWNKRFQQQLLQGFTKVVIQTYDIYDSQDLVDPSISWKHRAISTKIQWNAPGTAFMLNVDVALYIDIQVEH